MITGHNVSHRVVVDVPESWVERVEQSLGTIHDDITAMRMDFRRDIVVGVVTAVKELLADKTVSEAFWKTGYESLTKHSAEGASQWVGKKLLTTLIITLTMAGLVWLVKTGAIK